MGWRPLEEIFFFLEVGGTDAKIHVIMSSINKETRYRQQQPLQGQGQGQLDSRSVQKQATDDDPMWPLSTSA